MFTVGHFITLSGHLRVAGRCKSKFYAAFDSLVMRTTDGGGRLNARQVGLAPWPRALADALGNTGDGRVERSLFYSLNRRNGMIDTVSFSEIAIFID